MYCGPEGPAAGAKRTHAAEGREGERSETVVPEELTRQTIKPGTRQAKMQHMRQTKSHDYTNEISRTRQAKVVHIRRHLSLIHI